MVEGYRKLRALADSPAHLIPATTRWCCERYPAPSQELKGIAVRLD